MPQTIPTPKSFEERLQKILNLSLEEQEAMHREALSRVIPGRPLPEAKTLSDVFVGCMADVEDDSEKILEALNELS